MTESLPAGEIALLGAVPPDVRDALARDATLIPKDKIADLTAERRAGITRGLTRAMDGAPGELLDLLPNLRVLASVGAGVDLFDEADLERRGIAFRPTPHVMTEDTAEMAVALLFALCRNTVANDAHVRSGRWASERAGLGRRVSGLRAGIVGLGRIGKAVARRLEGLGVEVAYTGRSAKPDVAYQYVATPEALAREVDVLVLTCAGTAETRHLVSAEVLEALGPDGMLINVSRGTVVDEAALLAALEGGGISGAGLDVFENEPEPDQRFLALPNTVLSPHAAVFTHQNRVDLIAEMRRLLIQ